uniref:UBC core domain-containing protein n=1 Tax=Timema monikensis TaxID=170555 RepID=A0A7R9HU61_9NEOP|nr:unnamed protein product [Timema monikensis]
MVKPAGKPEDVPSGRLTWAAATNNGDLCISILHPPVDDPQSGELPCERWNPTQNVRTILLSVISLLNEPNTFSPANVDASVMYRRWRDSRGKDKEYENIIRTVVHHNYILEGGTFATAPEEETGGLNVWVVGLTTSTPRESRLMYQVFDKYPSPSDLY